MRLVLASASPRRRELLARAGVSFEVAPAEVDETRRPGEPPSSYVERVAREKAAAAARAPGDFVLAADTIVVCEGDVLGKPADAAEAADMLVRLGGRTHTVTTAVCLRGDAGSELLSVTTEVDVRTLGPAEIAGYVASGEWRGKAGGYAVQGIAAAFVPAIRGSYTNVVGLPVVETLALLARAGAPGPDFSRGDAA